MSSKTRQARSSPRKLRRRTARALQRHGRRGLSRFNRFSARAWRGLPVRDRWCIALFAVLLGGVLIWSHGLEPDFPAGDLCEIFERRPAWYLRTLKVERRYGLPQAVQMAVVRHESGYQARARPPRRLLWGWIPGPRPSSAFGYSQALDGTWARFQRATGRPQARRDRFSDSVELIGWYFEDAGRALGPRMRDPYHFYLAYNQGPVGYVNAVKRPGSSVSAYARRVAATADQYAAQLAGCRARLERRRIYFLILEALLIGSVLGGAWWYGRRRPSVPVSRRRRSS